MKVTPSIVQQEFIGLNAEVVKSSNPHYIGISGKVVDETRNVLVLLHQNEKKSIIKNVTVFDFTLPCQMEQSWKSMERSSLGDQRIASRSGSGGSGKQWHSSSRNPERPVMIPTVHSTEPSQSEDA